MIFDDLHALNTIIGLGATDKKLHRDVSDAVDPEVERLFKDESPPILEECMKYEIARILGKKSNSKDDIAASVDNDSTDTEEEEEVRKKAEDKLAALRRRLAGIPMDDCFRPVPVPTRAERAAAGGGGLGGGIGSNSRDSGDPPRAYSALTELLTTNAPNTTRLTIYLPTGTALDLHVTDVSTFEDIRGQILREHEQRKLQPPLHYHAPDCYEMRMHEEDGEPDMDFPPLGKSKTLAQMKTLNEYCLVPVKGRPVPPLPVQQSLPPTGAAPPAAPQPVASTYSASPLMSGLAGIALSGGRKTSRGGAPPVPYDPDIATRIAQPESSASSLNSSAFSTSSADVRFGNRAGPLLERMNSMMDSVMIIIGPVNEIVEIGPTTTLRDLLPEIHKRNRLRLYSDEFSFAITEEDQHRLKISSPITDLRVCVQALGVRVLELQKRVYVDSAVNKKTKTTNPPAQFASVQAPAAAAETRGGAPAAAAAGSGSGPPLPGGVRPTVTLPDRNLKITPDNSLTPNTVIVTSTSAAMYQQWLVVKRNTFGIRQQRVFGVDAVKVYNMKPGCTRQNPQVHRPERLIAEIRKVEVLDNKKSFKISWSDLNDVYDIEYTCTTADDCAEIVAKLLFLTSNNKREVGFGRR